MLRWISNDNGRTFEVWDDSPQIPRFVASFDRRSEAELYVEAENEKINWAADLAKEHQEYVDWAHKNAVALAAERDDLRWYAETLREANDALAEPYDYWDARIKEHERDLTAARAEAEALRRDRDATMRELQTAHGWLDHENIAGLKRDLAAARARVAELEGALDPLVRHGGTDADRQRAAAALAAPKDGGR
jgi:chromosome segregation ATPase